MPICIECSAEFASTERNRQFYARINVPEPKNCPDCRLKRKLAFRNERMLYPRKCDKCAKSVISLYSPKVKFPVYCSDCWYGDGWSGYDYGRDIDFTRSFFDQLKDLRDAVPHLATTVLKESCTNSDYCSWFDESRDCYLCFGSTKLEECMYCEILYNCKNTFDSTSSSGLERCFSCVDSSGCYACVWGVRLQNCTDCYFSYDLASCSNCLFSVNLRHKEYMIFNERVSSEVFKQEKERIFGSRAGFEEAVKKLQMLVAEKALHKFAQLVKCDQSTGNNLVSCGGSQNCFDSTELENCTNVSYGDRVKDCSDCYAVVLGSELCYEVFSHNGALNAQWSVASWTSSYNIQYSMYNRTSHDLFGCVGVQHGEYSILNKKYSVESFDEIKAKLIEHMKQTGEWGGFFPFSLSPFGYNETIAIDYFPLTKEQATASKCNWQDTLPGVYGKETKRANDLPDKISDVSDAVTADIISCGSCGKNFKIIKQELAFYRTLNLPLPACCPDCRYRFRLTFCTPRHLHHRQCMCDRPGHDHANQCANMFETTYASDGPEKVFCEMCYQKEVV